MTKRYLILFLILGLAGAVQADLEWQAVGGNVVTANQEVTINLVSTDNTCNGYALDGITEIDGSGDQFDDGGQVLSLTMGAGGNLIYAGDMDNYQGALFSVPSAIFSAPGLAANSTIFSFVYKVAADFDGEVTIAMLAPGKMYYYDGDSYEITGSIVNLGAEGNQTFTTAITLVPEPMTITLLGLGGLLLRRKNKK